MRDNGIGNTLGATARLENIEEVTVSTSQVGGNNGGQGTAVVQFVTKRGSNSFHGQAFWQHRNAALNANDWRNNAVDLPIGKFIMNDFGASFGGPILRDRLFFFVNYSENIQPTVATPQRNILTAGRQTAPVYATPVSFRHCLKLAIVRSSILLTTSTIIAALTRSQSAVRFR